MALFLLVLDRSDVGVSSAAAQVSQRRSLRSVHLRRLPKRTPNLQPLQPPRRLSCRMDRDGSRAATGQGPPAAAAGPTPSRPPPSPGIEALAAEALAFDGESNEESIDVTVEKALECPCLDDLKRGPCGSQFIDAFSCYLKSTKEEKGSDCVDPFIALQNCIGENKEAFIKEILEEEENDEEAEKSNLKVLPPAWSREPKSKTRGRSK